MAHMAHMAFEVVYKYLPSVFAAYPPIKRGGLPAHGDVFLAHSDPFSRMSRLQCISKRLIMHGIVLRPPIAPVETKGPPKDWTTKTRLRWSEAVL